MGKCVNVLCVKYPSCVDLVKVCGVDLRDASHEQAVEAIRRAGDNVVFLVHAGQHDSQVLHHIPMPANCTFF